MNTAPHISEIPVTTHREPGYYWVKFVHPDTNKYGFYPEWTVAYYSQNDVWRLPGFWALYEDADFTEINETILIYDSNAKVPVYRFEDMRNVVEAGVLLLEELSWPNNEGERPCWNEKATALRDALNALIR